MKKIIVLFLIIFCSTKKTFAHQDFWVIQDYGNVKVRIKTGYQYEEINKVFIYAQLVQKLALELDYKAPIFLDFNHHYTGDCIPDYFISFDKGLIEYPWTDATKIKPLLKNKSLVIRQVSRNFDAETTLKLVNYAIKNLSDIKGSQQRIEYNENYCQWKINSINPSKIKAHIKEPTSQKIRTIMSTKIVRPDKDYKFGYTYYWLNDKYVVIHKDYKGKESILKELNDLYDFKKVGNCFFVFTSNNEFFTINKTYGRRPKTISKTWTIKNGELNYRPYKLQHIGGYKYSIYFNYYSDDPSWQPKHITLIYNESQDHLSLLPTE